MRWIFIFLVFLNIFFCIWQYQQAAPVSLNDQNITNYGDTDIPTIKLLKEQPIVNHTPVINETNNQETPEVDSPIKEELTNIDNTETTETAPELLTCLYLGGFTNQEQLEVIDPFLEKVTSNINPTPIKITKTPKFHLYVIANSVIEQQTLLEKLSNTSINTLVISRGPLKDNISLGLFTDGTAYNEIQDKLKALEIPIKIEDLPESASSYWLKITNDKRLLFTHTILTDLTQQLPTMQQELMPCHLTEN